jgi:hypothetical protein
MRTATFRDVPLRRWICALGRFDWKCSFLKGLNSHETFLHDNNVVNHVLLSLLQSLF